jgi:hypothetical protein
MAEPTQNYAVEFTPAVEALVQADCNRAIRQFRLAINNRMARRLKVPEALPAKSEVKRTLRIGQYANLAVMAIAVLIALGRAS